MSKRMSSIYTGIGIEIIDMKIRTRAIEELLIEKGTVTADEIEERFKLVEERDGGKLTLEWINMLERNSELDNETE